MANIPRLRDVLMQDATRSTWIQPLAMVYWPYTTNPQGGLLLLLTGFQRNQRSKNKCFVIPMVHGLIYYDCQPISIQGSNHPIYNRHLNHQRRAQFFPQPLLSFSPLQPGLINYWFNYFHCCSQHETSAKFSQDGSILYLDFHVLFMQFRGVYYDARSTQEFIKLARFSYFHIPAHTSTSMLQRWKLVLPLLLIPARLVTTLACRT